MPLYSYRCPECGETHTELKKISDRHENPCPHCGATAGIFVTPVAFDTLHMGCDPSMPTFYDKWAKLQRAKNSGQTSDANNDRYERQLKSEKAGRDV